MTSWHVLAEDRRVESVEPFSPLSSVVVAKVGYFITRVVTAAHFEQVFSKDLLIEQFLEFTGTKSLPLGYGPDPHRTMNVTAHPQRLEEFNFLLHDHKFIYDHGGGFYLETI